jgi:hypothetical protein
VIATESLPVDMPNGAHPVSPHASFGEVVARRQKTATGRRLVIAAAVVVVLGLVVAVGALLMPRATVAVTLERIPFRAEVVYDIGVDPTAEAGVIPVPAEAVTVDVAVERTIPTTGRRLEPDGVAAAPVRFANPNAEPVTVPSDTRLGSLDGPEFELIEPVEVPAADPATGAAGQAEGQARSVEPGAIGNVGVGEIGGRLESGVYYSNREGAAEGGTDREVPVVAEADLTALSETTDAAIAEAALAEVAGETTDGRQPLPDTLAVVTKDAAPSAGEGDAVDALSVSATATVSVLVYEPDALAGGDRRAPARGGRGAGRPGPRPRDGPVRKPGPGLGSGRRGPPSSSGRGRRDPPVRPLGTACPGGTARNRRCAHGGDVARLDPGVEAWQIDYSPDWLPPRMPGDPDRIEIEVVG